MLFSEKERKKKEEKKNHSTPCFRGNDERSPDDAFTKGREVFTAARKEEDPSSSSFYRDEGGVLLSN